MLSFLKNYSAAQTHEWSLQEVRALKTELSRTSVTDLFENFHGHARPTASPFLLVRLFRPILELYRSTENQFHLKVALCDVLATWLTKACRACSDIPQVATNLRRDLRDEDFQALYDAMLVDWDLGGPIHAPLRDIFSKSLALQKLILPSHASEHKQLLLAALEMDHMQKSLYYAIEILRKFLGTSSILQCEQNFFTNRLRNMRETTIATPLGRLLANVMIEPLGTESTPEQQIQWLLQWQSPVVACLYSADETLSSNVVTYLLPSLFKVSKVAFDLFISDLINKDDTNDIDEDTRLKVLIECLFKAKQVQIIGDLNDLVLQQLRLPANFLESVLSHGVPAIRAAGLQLVVYHPKLTTLFHHGTYRTLQNALSCQFHETDMQLRKEILSGFRAFFMRFQASAYACITALKRNKADKVLGIREMEEYLRASENFAGKLVRALKANLEPGNGYQVTYTSLQLLQLASAYGWCAGPSATCDKYASFKTPKSSAQEKPLPFAVGMFDAEMVRLLLDRLGDSFDDNRTLALALLMTTSNTLSGLQSEAQTDRVVQNANRLLYSTRGRDGDGGARMLQLIFQRFVLQDNSVEVQKTLGQAVDGKISKFLMTFLDDIEKDIVSARTNMLTSARRRPLHGRLTALRYMIESLQYGSHSDSHQDIQNWSRLNCRIVESCRMIWETIKEVLTDDSPEGNLPTSMESNSDVALRGQDAQVILSFCWRALRETSNLLTTVIVKTPNSLDHEYMSVADYRAGGQLSLSWLTEVRHRGAFSAVFPNVITISKCLLTMKHHPSLTSLPPTWLDRNIDELSQVSHRKDITRRSGGLPMSIISLMISDVEHASGSTKMVDKAMSRLILLVTSPLHSGPDEMELPQVHGLNTLKDIFLESKLASSSIDYVERCFIISIDGFSSPVWAIRNCCLMLFSALIRRSFGSRTSRAESATTTYTANNFFTRYPVLLSRLTQELQTAVDGLFSSSGSVVTTGLHPCLCLLTRLDLVDTSEVEDDSSYEELLRLVSLIATSPVWQIRSIAAQAIPTLVERELVGSFIIQHLNQATTLDQNALHGRLLMIYHLLQYNLDQHTSDVLFVEQILSDLRRAITNKFVDLSSENPCATTEALWLRILMFLARTIHSEQNASLRQRVVDYCARELANPLSKGRNVVGVTERNSVMTAISMRALADPKFKRFQSSSTSDALSSLIEDGRVEVRMQVYSMLQTTFQSSSILKSPKVHSALRSRSINESWPIARNAARCCISNLPGTLHQDEQIASSEVFTSYMEELQNLKHGTPSSDVTLQLVGQFQGQSKSDELLGQFASLLRKFSVESQSVDTRMSVLQALRSLSKVKDSTKYVLESEQMLVYLLPVYLALLTDDDEEIRTGASETICNEIDGHPTRTPERTRECLLILLAHKHSESQSLQDILLEEITGNEDPIHALSVASLPSDQLFAMEKQNLWRNNVTNCRQALGALSLMVVSQVTITILGDWCIAAFQGILSQVQALEQDGPLGWTSLPETWQIIRRTLLVKDWLLSRDKTESSSSSQIKDLLGQIARAGEGKALHPTLTAGLMT